MGKPREISYKRFIEGNFVMKKREPKDHPVLVFLRNRKNAYNIDAIVKATGMNPSTVRGKIRHLKKKGLVLHKQPFFAYKR